MAKLQPKQQTVINEYFNNGFDKKEALISAGYSTNNINQSIYNFFKSLAVQEEISARQSEIAEKGTVSTVVLQKHLWKVYDDAMALKKLSDAKLEIDEKTSFSDIMRKVEELESAGVAHA